ncbi:hypothetical protein AURDEDRAFT_180033 [Auricularia subglabra TFB-10046 SS5]|nr:hypothetical protein AURDEDRAFT_180033 [Auricularia subglabra TFB-10046 SS5]
MSQTAPSRIAREFFDALGAKDLDTVGALLADDMRLQMLPESMGMGTIGKAQWLANMKAFQSMTSSGTVKIEILEVIDAAETNQVILHCRSFDTFAKDGKTPYANEYIFIFTVIDGKIARAKEMLDSKFYLGFLAEFVPSALPVTKGP